MDHPPYLPDYTPCDFWLFPQLKTALKGYRFSDTAYIQGHTTPHLKNIPIEEFQKHLEERNHHIIMCIGAERDYFK